MCSLYEEDKEMIQQLVILKEGDHTRNQNTEDDLTFLILSYKFAILVGQKFSWKKFILCCQCLVF
jgi:hypothetical protein